MYVLFFGDNRMLVRDEATSFIKTGLPAGKSYHAIEKNNFEPGAITDAAGATSLFGETEWYVLDEPSHDEAYWTEVEQSLELMSQSHNQFVILESKLLAPKKKLYSKYATEVQEFTTEKGAKSNPFLMAEALANKDKRKLWVLVQEAKMGGMREEEIIGILWWQLKTLRLAAQTSSPQEAGLKDFPYNKAKRALSKFKSGELDELSHQLLNTYHEGHAGLTDLDLGLERWVLTI